jgi:hypothetical protein
MPLAILREEVYKWAYRDPIPLPFSGGLGQYDHKGGPVNTAANATPPKIGSRVGTTQQEGVFEVADINSLMQTANLKSTDGQGHITRNVPWTSLKPIHK